MKLKLFLISFFLLFVAFSAKAATLNVSPASGSFNVGATFKVDILLNTQSQAIDGVDINALNYDPTALEVQDQGTAAGGKGICARVK